MAEIELIASLEFTHDPGIMHQVVKKTLSFPESALEHLYGCRHRHCPH